MAKIGLNDQNRIRIAYDRKRQGNLVYNNYLGRIPTADVAKIIFWSRKIGDDGTGDGTFALPYLTYTRALEDVTSTKRYVLELDDIYFTTDPAQKVFLDLINGNDGNTGLTEGSPKLTYAAAITVLDSNNRIAIEIIDGAGLAMPANDDLRAIQVRIGIECDITSWNYATVKAPKYWRKSHEDSNPPFSFSQIAELNGRFVKTGRVSTTQPTIGFKYSDDKGLTWNLCTVSPSVSSAGLDDFFTNIVNVDGILFAGKGLSDNSYNVYVSFDGINFNAEKFSVSVPNTQLYFNVVKFLNKYILTEENLILYSDDAINFTERSDIGITNIRGAIVYKDKYYISSASPSKIYSSSDGETFTVVNSGNTVHKFIISDDILIALTTTKIISTADGVTWTERVIGIAATVVPPYGKYRNSLFVVRTENNKIYRSSDGITWNFSNTNEPFAYQIFWHNGFWIAATQNGTAKIEYSADAITWTYGVIDSYPGTEQLAYTEKFAAIGNRVIFIINQYTFIVDILGAKFSNIKSIPTSIAGLGDVNDFQNVYIEDDAVTPLKVNQIQGKNSIFKATGNLIGLNITGPYIDLKRILIIASSQSLTVQENTFPASSLNIISSTFIGIVSIKTKNKSGINAVIQDVIVYGNINSINGEGVSIQSGDISGTTSGVSLASGILRLDPDFKDITSYQLKRLVESDIHDSVIINLSKFARNTSGNVTDFGAWITDEIRIGYVFTLVYDIVKGSVSHGKTIESVEQIGETGEEDVYTNTDRFLEVMTNEISVVTDEDIAFIDQLDAMTDKKVDIVLDYEEIQAATVTVDGAHSVGDVVLNIDETTFQIGRSITIAGEKYTPLYVLPDSISTVKLVLNKPLKSNVLDNAVINVTSPLGFGQYSYSPITGRDNQRFIKINGEYRSGIKMRFIRKWQ